jgi:hypothetical protein
VEYWESKAQKHERAISGSRRNLIIFAAEAVLF